MREQKILLTSWRDNGKEARMAQWRRLVSINPNGRPVPAEEWLSSDEEIWQDEGKHLRVCPGEG